VGHPLLRALAGAGLVVVSCSAVQGSAAVCSTLFDTIGPTGAAAWRQAIGALVLIAVLRPRLAGRTRAEWGGIAALGVAVAVMNAAFYSAVDRVPLGVAATLIYLVPCLLAMAHTRQGWTRLLPVVALIGVVLVGSDSHGSAASGVAHASDRWVGVALGLVAASALVVYTLASQRLGAMVHPHPVRTRGVGGLDRLALAVTVSALLLSPFAVESAPAMPSRGWPLLGAAGAIGVAFAFSCDFTALKLAGTRVVATLFALDPVIGSIIGAVALSQDLAWTTTLGIGAIVVAGAVTTATHGRGRQLDRPVDAAGSARPSEPFDVA
jgi:inner membrane transporter RhtA